MSANSWVKKGTGVLALVIILALLMPQGAHAKTAVHVVKRGENLSRIAARYGTSVNAIVRANGIRNANLIYSGQRLRIPGKSSGSSKSNNSNKSSVASGQKWIEVDLSRQRVAARQGNKTIKTFKVSTGTARYPTPTGTFRIYARYRSTRMTGPGYDLKGVPWTMYFYRGYALHGTYWHHNFGHPMSHGCINLRTKDARWLYKWASYGTKVKIHR